MAGSADPQIQFDMRRHQVPLHVDELRPTDSKFSIDEGLLCPEPKKNEMQLFGLIQDDETETCCAEDLEEITGAGHPPLLGEHEPHSWNDSVGLEGVSTLIMNAGAGALQYSVFGPTVTLLEDDQKDLEAQELIPGFSVTHGSINSNGFFQVVHKLTRELAHSDLHKVSHAKQYARLLLRLANKLTVLPFDDPSCLDNFLDPKQYAECLDALAKDMFLGIQLAGPRDSEVYVSKNCAPYADCLRLLATELSSG